jgi:hypothetical protein
MKKLLMLIVFPVMLAGCSEKEEVKPAENKFSGTWIKYNMRIKYLDASGKIIMQEDIADENGDKLIFSAEKVTVIENSGSKQEFNYQATETSISFGNNSYNIAKLDANVLHLESKFNQLLYNSKSAVLVEQYMK